MVEEFFAGGFPFAPKDEDVLVRVEDEVQGTRAKVLRGRRSAVYLDRLIVLSRHCRIRAHR